MPSFAPPPVTPPSLALAFRFALRELRGGVAGFRIFIACIALGVMAIAGVLSIGRALTTTIAEEGQTLLGGDIAFSLLHVPPDADQRAFLAKLGSASEVATLRAMARKPETLDQALAEVKAVDAAYPLYGRLEVEGGGDWKALTAKQPDGSFGALAEQALLVRLDLKVGDRIALGAATLTLTGVIAAEPDKAAGGIGFGPRLLITRDALAATDLVQPGSLIRFTTRVRVAGTADEARLAAIEKQAEVAFPKAGWEVRSRANAAPGLKANIERFTQFLTLVGLTALVIGGVGVANAVRSYLDRKREVIATWKCLGATGGFVFKVYALEVMMLAGIGIAIGLALGSVLPIAIGAYLADIVPIGARAAVYPRELLLAVAYGFLTAAAFALPVIGRAHDVPPTALFRGAVETARRWPRRRYLIMTAIVLAALVGLVLTLSDDPRITMPYLGALVGAFVVLRGVGLGIMALARRMPHLHSTEWRLAIAAIHRPGALTPSVVLSLGLGLTLLVALAGIDYGLRAELTSKLPKQAPSFFFLDVPSRDAAAFRDLIGREARGATIEEVPMLRGRIVALKGAPAAETDVEPNARWVLSGDRGITFSETLPEHSTLVGGQWWAKDYAGPPLVSFDSELAKGLHLGLGDKLTVNVLGREFEVTIASLRKVEWDSLAINFVMVFSPNTFKGAPVTRLATVTWPGGGTAEQELALLRTVTRAYPAITSLRVKDALQSVEEMITKLSLGVRVAAGVTVIASVLVLAGALASGQRRRLYDAVILKTLGATRRRLVSAFGLEFALLGAATAVFGLAAGTGAAWYVLTKVMRLSFAFSPTTAVVTILAALVATVGFGLIGTWRALGEKPTILLRDP